MKIFRIAACALMASGLVTGSAALPASAAKQDTINYVALGDSYASGFGAGSYGECGQSPLGTAGLLDERKKVELTFNAACAGARAANIAGGVPDVPEQLGGLVALGAIGPQTDLVTLSAGGNDVNFGAIIGACTTGPTACQQAVDAATAYANTVLVADLQRLYAQVAAVAPNAQVVVTGYPHLFSPEFGNEPLLSIETQEIFNAGTDALNAVIRAQAEAAGFEYVDVVKRFDKHGIGSRDPWITFTGFTAIDDLHPNAKGYKSGYLPEVRKAVN